MYQESIAKYTADHLRTHIREYLDIVQASTSSPGTTKLVLPKSIADTSTIGGLLAELGGLTPIYGVDCADKQLSTRRDDVYLHEYEGFITGLLTAPTKEIADQLMKRHAAAVELFVKNHLYLHGQSFTAFMIVEYQYLSTSFTGASYLEDSDSWLSAFTVNTLWLTSEGGAGQHA
jgi:hypothetical protein